MSRFEASRDARCNELIPKPETKLGVPLLSVSLLIADSAIPVAAKSESKFDTGTGVSAPAARLAPGLKFDNKATRQSAAEVLALVKIDVFTDSRLSAVSSKEHVCSLAQFATIMSIIVVRD